MTFIISATVLSFQRLVYTCAAHLLFSTTELSQPSLANYRPSVITKLELHAYIFGMRKSGARGEHDSQHGNEYKLYDQIVKSRT